MACVIHGIKFKFLTHSQLPAGLTLLLSHPCRFFISHECNHVCKKLGLKEHPMQFK